MERMRLCCRQHDRWAPAKVASKNGDNAAAPERESGGKRFSLGGKTRQPELRDFSEKFPSRRPLTQHMPRRARCVLPGVACHITQRGVDRRETFSSDQDRHTYLRLLRENLSDAELRLFGWYLMTNHVHLVAVPGRDDSLAVLLRRVHGRYAQYYNACHGRTGHLWQNRFFACVLSNDHLWKALAYVERNPVRAWMAPAAGVYRWSSAAAHLTGVDGAGILDMAWWRREGPAGSWGEVLDGEDGDVCSALRRCTHAGRPYGSESFVKAMSERFGRYWVRGRPKKEASRPESSGDAGGLLE